MGKLDLPFDEPLFVFGEHRRRHLRGKIWIRQFLLHLYDFGLNLFNFLGEADFFGGEGWNGNESRSGSLRARWL